MTSKKKTLNECSHTKHCFVTVGATASFQALIEVVLSPKFLLALQTANYTHLTVQYGLGGEQLYESLLKRTIPAHQVTSEVSRSLELPAAYHTININGFSLSSPNSFRTQLASTLQAKTAKPQVEGLLIAHAGTGTLLDALAVDVPMVLVPNERLADNHQAELAEKMATEGFCVRGNVENLDKVILEVESWRGIRKRKHDRNSKNLNGGIWKIIDEEMGFK